MKATRKGALRVRRQQEDGSGLGNLLGGLAEEARSPGSCTSTRAVEFWAPRKSSVSLPLSLCDYFCNAACATLCA